MSSWLRSFGRSKSRDLDLSSDSSPDPRSPSPLLSEGDYLFWVKTQRSPEIGQKLTDLWTCYVEDASPTNLMETILFFNSKAAVIEAQVSDDRSADVALKPGHVRPPKLLAALAEGIETSLRQAMAELAEKKEGAGDSEPFEAASLILAHLEILSKHPQNRKPLVFHGVLGPVLEFTAFVASRFLSLAETPPPSKPREKERHREEPELKSPQDILTKCLRLLEVLSDPTSSWKSYMQSWNPVVPSAAENPLSGHLKSITTAITAIVDVLKACALITESGYLLNQRQYTLRIGAVTSLGCLIFSNQIAQNKLDQLGGLTALQDAVGWPKFLSSTRDKRKYFDYDSIPCEVLQSEFITQVLAWQTLRSATIVNSKNLKKMEASGSELKLIDLLLWVAKVSPAAFNSGAGSYSQISTLALSPSFFTSHNSQLLDPNHVDSLFSPAVDRSPETYYFTTRQVPLISIKPKFPGRNWLLESRELDILFRLIHSSILAELLGHQLRVIGEDQALTISSFQHDRLLSHVNALFNPAVRPSDENTQVRAHLRKAAPIIQFFVIELLSRLLEFEAETLRVWREINIWETLFSENFFYWGQGEKAEDVRQISVLLSTAVLNLTVYSGSLSSQSKNIEQVHQLLQLLERNPKSPEIILQGCDSLFSLLYFNGDGTKQSMVHLDSMKIINGLLDKYFASNMSREDSTSIRLWVRMALLGCFDQFLDTASNSTLEAHLYIFEKKDSLAFMLNHLTDSAPRVRAVCLKHVLGIILTIATIEDDESKRSSSLKSGYFLFRFLDFYPPYLQHPDHFEVLINMLQGLRTITNLKPRNLQRTFSQLDFPEKILKCIDNLEVCSVENKRRAMVEIFNLFTAVFANNSETKNLFKTSYGFPKLAQRLLWLTPDLWEGLLNPLFGLLVDEEFDPQSRMIIKHEEALNLFFGLYPFFNPELQLQLLDKFTTLLGPHFNRMQFCRQSRFSTFCELLKSSEFPEHREKIVGILEILGCYSIRASEYRTLLGTLKSTTASLPPYYGQLLQVLVQMARPTQEPQVVFQYFAENSGLTAKIDKWTSNHGMTFYTWFRMEPDNSPVPSRPSLFSVADPDMNGIEFFLSNGFLHAESRSSGAIQSTEFSFPFEVEKWYFIAITHSSSKKKGGAHEVIVSVNGNENRLTSSLVFPLSHTPLTFRIGASIFSIQDQERSSFWGQIASVYIFDDILSPTQIQTIFELGPGFTFQFLDDISGLAVDANLRSRLFLNFNPNASHGDVCVDLAHRHAKPIHGKLRNVFKSATLKFREIIHAQGGLPSLFPLVLQIDGTQTGPPFNLSVSTLQLFKALLDKSPRNQEDMLFEKKLAVLSHLYQQVHPRNVDFDFLASISKEFGLFAVQKESDDNDDLRADLHLYFVCEFRLWIYNTVENQHLFIRSLFELIQNGSLPNRDDYGVPFLFDVLEQIYWYTPSYTSVPDTLVLTKGPTEATVRRPSVEQITSLRKEVLQFLKSDFFPQFTVANTTRLMTTLLLSNDDLHVYELLETVFEYVAENPESLFLEILLQNTAPEVFCELLTREMEKIRTISLTAISFLVVSPKVADKFKKRLRFDDGVSFGLYQLLRQRPFSKAIYTALLPLALEFNPTKPPDQIKSLPFKNVAVLEVILMLIGSAENALKAELLTDFTGFFIKSAENCATIFKIPKWVEYLLELIKDQPADATTAIIEGTIELFCQIILGSLQGDKKGWKMVEGFISSMVMTKMPCRKTVSKLLFTKVFEMAMHLNEKTPVALGNYAHLLLTFEEVSFFSIDVNLEVFAKFAAKVSNRTSVIDPELSDFEKNRSVRLHSGQTVENLIETSLPSQSIGITVSPNIRITDDGDWTEELAAERALRAMSTLDFFGLSSFSQLESKTTKGHFRHGGPLRIALNMIFCCLRSSNSGICAIAAEHLRTIAINLIFLKKDSGIFSTKDEMKGRILSILAALHQAFLKSKSRPGSTNSEVILPVYKAILKKWSPLIAFEKSEARELVLDQKILDSENHDSFARFLDSEFSQVFESQLQPALQGFEDECANHALGIQKRQMKVLKELLQMLKKEEISELAGERKFASSQKTFMKPHWEASQAIALKRSIADNERKQVSRSWKQMYRNLTRERGAWAPEKDVPVHWKLDKVENFSRMRRKLVVNYDFNDHKDASAKRDREKNSSDQVVGGVYKIPANAVGKLGDLGELPQEEDDPEGSGQVVISQDDIEKIIEAMECELIVLTVAIKGKLSITSEFLYFHLNRPELADSDVELLEAFDSESLKDKRWPLSSLLQVHQRRYLLTPSAIELFFKDNTNYFLNFSSRKARKKILATLSSIGKSRMLHVDSGSPQEMFRKSQLDKKWQRREISNFEYLMHLNTFAGRTFNDLTQYPVFPWILSDYESETIHLTNAKVYRDLTKPIGALNEKRLEQFIERCETFEDPSGIITPFLYGTHYSSAAGVMFYLLRMEPFTTLHINLQSGKFDWADRQFHSIPEAWKSVTSSMIDVKELTPEFFFLPEFLENMNDFDLGFRQTGEKLGNVILPKWASTPEEFIRINREALESEYVSLNLHHWIDLMFGYKQRGPEAKKANNVFYYLTYEGSVDLEKIEDPHEKKAIQDQINNFGQTPTQLFTRPHIERSKLDPSIRGCTLERLTKTGTFLAEVSANRPLCFISTFGPTDRIVTINQDRALCLHDLTYSSGSFKLSKEENDQFQTLITAPVAHDVSWSPGLFVITGDGKNIFTCGHWDNSFKSSSLENKKFTRSYFAHNDVVTCLGLSEDGKVLVTGSRDTTVISWDLEYGNVNTSSGLSLKKRHIFHGHDDEVTSVAVNVEHDILLTGSLDGTCIIHSLRSGTYIRTLRLSSNELLSKVKQVGISIHGSMVVAAERAEQPEIYLFGVNGKRLKKVTMKKPINQFVISKDGKYLVVANPDQIPVLLLHNLKSFGAVMVETNPSEQVLISVNSVTLTSDGNRILAGLSNGRFLLVTDKTPNLQTLQESKISQSVFL